MRSHFARYVRGLERRIKEMENKHGPNSQRSPPGEERSMASGNDRSYGECIVADIVISNPDSGALPALSETNVSESFPDLPSQDARLDTRFQEPDTNFETLIQEPSPTFDNELKSVSYSVAAERHLGSTSGLSFARLTQMVLRRLTPDKADFVFGNSRSNYTSNQLFDFDSSLNFFNSSVFETLSESMSNHPTLFGDILLVDTIEPTDAVSGLSFPTDEVYINRLVDFYFAHSHTLYPIIVKIDFMKSLKQVQENPLGPAAQCPLTLFRIWMVFAIGSTAYASVTLGEESESRVYYSKALEYFEPTMSFGEIVSC